MRESKVELGVMKGGVLLGVFLGASALAILAFFFTSCETNASTLWFCNEEEAVVLATLEFIQALVASVAWPIAIVVISLLFRREIHTLFSGITLKKVKVGNAEAEFETAVSRAADELEEAAATGEIADQPPSARFAEYLDDEQSSKFAVLAAWNDVDTKLRRLRKLLSPADFSQRTMFVSDRELSKMDFPRSLVAAMSDLRRARNQIAHDNDIVLTKSQIIRYLDLAADVDFYLENRLRNLDPLYDS